MSVKDTKCIAFIPARCGSKSIPLKNIKYFLGKPLIEWCIVAAQESQYVDEIIVSTDCNEIRDCINSMPYSKLVVFDRDPSNATDEASTESAMLDYINRSNCSDDMLFILIQASSPWIQASDLNAAIRQIDTGEIDSLLSVVENHSFLWDSKGHSINYDYANRKRRQDMDKQYQENGSFYINRVGDIRKTNNRLSGKIGYHQMHKFSAFEIDEPADWSLAESLMEKFINKS